MKTYPELTATLQLKHGSLIFKILKQYMTLRLTRLPLRSIRRLLAMTEPTSPSTSTDRIHPTELGATDTQIEAGLNAGLDVTDSAAGTGNENGVSAGPSVRAADKWVKVNGPPVGVTFGARRIEEGADLWSHNAW